MTMMDDFDLEDVELEDELEPEESSNRTFLLVAGILGGILILSLQIPFSGEILAKPLQVDRR